MKFWSRPLILAVAVLAIVWLIGIAAVRQAAAQATKGAPPAAKTQIAGEAFKNLTTSTLKGSSGAPVLNDQLEVVGVHNKGGDRVLEPVSGARFNRNEGSAAGAILDDLHARSPAILDRFTALD